MTPRHHRRGVIFILGQTFRFALASGIALCVSNPIYRGPEVKKLIKLKDVLACVPVSRSQLYAMISEGKFPAQVHLGGSAAFWVESEVTDWIQAHIDERIAA